MTQNSHANHDPHKHRGRGKREIDSLRFEHERRTEGGVEWIRRRRNKWSKTELKYLRGNSRLTRSPLSARYAFPRLMTEILSRKPSPVLN